MKRLLCVCLTVLFLCACCVPALAADGQGGAHALSFGEDGKFTILVATDIHEVYPMTEAESVFLREAVAAVQPDLVVLDGDNMVCKGTEIYDQLLEPFVSAGVPFTFVFGNHDRECSDLTREEQMAQYSRAGGALCLAYDAVPELSGCGTHNLPVLSSDGSRVAFNLWMFDSGDNVPGGGYDRVHADQVEWYRENSVRLERENGGKVPSLAFQHIIAKQVFDAVYVPARDADGAFRTFDDGTAFSKKIDRRAYDGYLCETPCPSYYDDGQWAAFAARGDVLGCVSGHDHVNNFVATYDGVDLIQTSSAGHRAYGSVLSRGVRVITVDENDPWTYETHTVYESDLAMRLQSKIPSATHIPHFVYAVIRAVTRLVEWIY